MEEIELFVWKGFKLPKVEYRKLGKERNWGQYIDDKIELDERLKGKKLLEILLHEGLHAFDGELSENNVRKLSRFLTELVWKENFRRTDNNE